jgi:hypothetical protein
MGLFRCSRRAITWCTHKIPPEVAHADGAGHLWLVVRLGLVVGQDGFIAVFTPCACLPQAGLQPVEGAILASGSSGKGE